MEQKWAFGESALFVDVYSIKVIHPTWSKWFAQHNAQAVDHMEQLSML